VDALNYILKPVNRFDFALKMNKAISRTAKRTEESVQIRAGKDLYMLPVAAIRYLEVDGHYIVYHTTEGDYSEYITLKEAEKKPAEEDAQTRMNRDVAEFQKEFPGVELSSDQIKKMGPDIRNGMSMVNAYRKMKDAEKDAEIAELKRQLEAAGQNKKNKAKTPGSMKDSGGQRKKTAEDDFFSAFEK
jgi:hypothetical protein